MSKIKIKDISESEIDTVLAEDIDFVGELSFKESLMIKGNFKGDIKASGDLYIGKDAAVEARIEADLISLKGKVKGNIFANSMVEMFSDSRIEGDVTTPDIVMESGCTFNGICKMITKKENKNERK